MKILAVETSGKTFGATLNIDEKTVADFYYDCGNKHSDIFFSSIERMLKEANVDIEEIDKFAVSLGPGSFTGIRIGITAVRTLAQCLQKPVFYTDTLTILENSFPEIKNVKTIVAIDALREEVYIKKSGKIIIKNINVFLETLKNYNRQILLVGNAAIVYKEKIKKTLKNKIIFLPEKSNFPQSCILASLAFHSKTFYKYKNIEPLYIRKSWAEENLKKK
jgi:tRNA threonylcarbamoyl adenosine modification protein YeaZ